MLFFVLPRPIVYSSHYIMHIIMCVCVCLLLHRDLYLILTTCYGLFTRGQSVCFALAAAICLLIINSCVCTCNHNYVHL